MPVRAVGIDLGTTNSSIAIVGEDGQSHAIPNAEGLFSTPSVVLWNGERFLVGQPALEYVQNTNDTERTKRSDALIRNFKRMIGEPPNEGLISNNKHTSPVDASAAILAKLARDASAHLGFPVQEAVITVPAHFGDRERDETRKAAQMAGLNILQILNEPTAAALNYTQGRQAQPGLAMVFDLGGGTFDATILQFDAQGARVLATQGIEELGGINFTNALMVSLQQRYKALTKTPYPEDNLSLDKLAAIAETAKCALSTEQKTSIVLAPVQGEAVELEITRTQFEELIDLYVFQLQMAVEMVLERAHKQPSDIHRVLLCGGSSRIPAVQNMLTALFGKSPEQVMDLDLSVALGAAYQALNREQQIGLQIMPGVLIVDCVSYPVGIAVRDAQGQRYIKLIMLRQGDPLDKWSRPFAVRVIGSITHFPPIAVYKGESEEPATEDYLGEIPLQLPPHTREGAQASIQMRQDQSGLIHVQLMLDGNELPGSLQRPQS